MSRGAFLAGRTHIFTCGLGHQWESGDKDHHPAFAYESSCPHGPYSLRSLIARCTSRCVSLKCPKGCVHYREPDGLIVFAPQDPFGGP